MKYKVQWYSGKNIDIVSIPATQRVFKVKITQTQQYNSGYNISQVAHDDWM
jgi:hypothetical protein